VKLALSLFILAFLAYIVRGIWRLRRVSGVRGGALGAYFVVLWFTSMYLGVMNAGQPFVLSEYLHIPLEQHGQVSGYIQTGAELVMILTVGLAGVLSDRIGRPIVYALGFLIASLGVALYTHATDLTQLLLFRAIYTVGAAGLSAMLVTVLSDYVVDEDRGKANGFQGFVAGAGAIFTFLFLTQLPRLIREGANMTAAQAGHISYYIVAGLGLLAAAISWFFLARYRPEQAVRQNKPMPVLAREALGAARRDPGVALAYAAAFVSRGDLAVAGVFVMTWINAYLTEHGATTDEAIAQTGMIAGITPITATLAAPIWGAIADRVNRVTALAVILLLAFVAYGGVYFVDTPVSPTMKVLIGLIGVAEIGGFVASQALVAQQAPPAIRGSVIGFFGFCGAIGILVGTAVGGTLTRTVGPWAPFVMFAGFNLLVAVWALVVRGRVRPHGEGLLEETPADDETLAESMAARVGEVAR
jgi:MFS family permease